MINTNNRFDYYFYKKNYQDKPKMSSNNNYKLKLTLLKLVLRLLLVW